MLTGETGSAPPATEPQFRLLKRNGSTATVMKYLTEARRIDEDVAGFFISGGDIYEDAEHHNAVFVGRDERGIPRYAHNKGTAGSFRLDMKGSNKAFNFFYRGEGEKLLSLKPRLTCFLSFACSSGKHKENGRGMITVP
jgi:hypothetical protein